MNQEYAALAKNLQKRTRIAPAELTALLEKFKREEIGKQEYLLTAHSLCQSIYYIYRGCCKSYVIDSAGKERVIMFAFDDWWITDIDSFTLGRTTQINIQAIAASIVYRLSKHDFEVLIDNYPSFESAFRQMMQYAYIREQNRALELITSDAYHRYQSLIKRYPQIQQAVPQKDIASYLGITPEFLSTLRIRMSKA